MNTTARKTWRNHIWWLAGWFPALVGLCAWLVVLLDPDAGFIWLALLPFTLFSCYALSIILHELGHYAAALLLGLRPMAINIGSGRCLFFKRLPNGLVISVRTVPTWGFVTVFSLGRRLLKTRWGLMTLAGPLANLLLALGAFIIIFFVPDWREMFGGHPRAADIVWMMLLVNLALGVVSLIPIEALFLNDGVHLLRLIFDRKHQVSLDHYASPAETADYNHALARALAQGNEPLKRESEGWTFQVTHTGSEVLLEGYAYLLENVKMPEERRLCLLDMFATTVLLHDAREYLPLADRYSEELFRLRPKVWTAMGTRGSILVEIGKPDEGIPLLETAFENDPLPGDKALCAAAIAIAEIRRGNLQSAQDWMSKALKWNPNCLLLHRAEKMCSESSRPKPPKGGRLESCS